jgi:hypothetical protein
MQPPPPLLLAKRVWLLVIGLEPERRFSTVDSSRCVGCFKNSSLAKTRGQKASICASHQASALVETGPADCAWTLGHRPRCKMSAKYKQSAEEHPPKRLLAEPAAQRAASRQAEKRRRERGG